MVLIKTILKAIFWASVVFVAVAIPAGILFVAMSYVLVVFWVL